jgi:hypothetical protein
MWPDVHPANFAASSVLTMSLMSRLSSIVATPHLRRADDLPSAYCSLPTELQRRGRDSNLNTRQLNRCEVQSSEHHRPAQETGSRTRSLLTDAHGCEGV